eukprot:TRINITY_DN38365_c0_g1_i1.p1 TRINITY_DN38365_c0_g1~~TRINITY_DN38365_c0_g1_i1.p1  ORF type:complete len:316 (+),score=80.69 TRINITY_DN38365_c0_g1_i1:73-1020(+)
MSTANWIQGLQAFFHDMLKPCLENSTIPSTEPSKSVKRPSEPEVGEEYHQLDGTVADKKYSPAAKEDQFQDLTQAIEETLSDADSVPSVTTVIQRVEVEAQEITHEIVEPKDVDVINFPVRLQHDKSLPAILSRLDNVKNLNDTMTSIASTITETDSTSQMMGRNCANRRESYSLTKTTPTAQFRRLSTAPSISNKSALSDADPDSEVFQNLCKERVKVQTLKNKLKEETAERKKLAELYDRNKEKCNKLVEQVQHLRKDLAKVKTENTQLKQENQVWKAQATRLRTENQNLKNSLAAPASSSSPPTVLDQNRQM